MSVSVLNTTASLSGKTLAKLEDSQTFTGQKTFDLGASAPFVVVSGAAKVANLDADKLDGQTGADYHDASLLTGVLPVTTVEADPNADRIVFWDDSAGAFKFLSLANLAINGTSLTAPISDPCGRLSLTTGTPVTTGDVTAATTLYWALYKGNTAQLYNGSAWETFALAQLSIAVPATTSQMYDVFLDYNSGTPALSLTAWTNDTTRATALTTQNGVLVLTGTLGKRYLGSFRTTGVSGQTEDSVTKRYVWNYYHRIRRRLLREEGTASWPYTTATVRQANGATANQVETVIGVAEVLLDLRLNVTVANSTGGPNMSAGIGQGSTTTYAAGVWNDAGSTTSLPMIAELVAYPAVGYQFWSWNEWSEASGVTTWYGAQTNGSNTNSGLRGWIEG